MTAFAAGAGPPAKRMATRRIEDMLIVGSGLGFRSKTGDCNGQSANLQRLYGGVKLGGICREFAFCFHGFTTPWVVYHDD